MRFLVFPQSVALLAALFACVGCDRGPAPAPAEPDEIREQPRAEPTAAELPADERADPPGPPAPILPAVAGIHYLEVITGDAVASDPLPMIVAIHGLGDTPFGFQSLLADFPEPARVILPRAIHKHEVGYAWFRRRARDPDVKALAHGVSKATDRLAPAVRLLVEQKPTIGKPILTGFSQGGILTFALSTRYPELFSSAIAVGGWLPPPLWPKAEAPKSAPAIVALHGEEDPAVKFKPTKAAVEHLQRQGYTAQIVSYPGVRHAIPPEMRADLLGRLREAVAAQSARAAAPHGASTDSPQTPAAH